MTFSSFGRLAGVVLALGLLSACSVQENRERMEEAANQAQQNIELAKTPSQRIQHQSLTVTDRVWAGSTAMRLRNGQPLPERVERPRAIAYASAEPVALSDLLATISGQSGIPVRLGTGAEAMSSQTMPVSYEGALSGLLNQIANYNGLNWRYDGGAITMARYETRVFVVEALPGTSKYTDEVSGDSSSSSSGGSSSGGSGSSNALKQESTLEAELDFWDEIKTSVDNLLGGQGTALVSESAGTITVTTTAENMKTIASYIEQQNKLLARQIAINVEVYTVDLAENENFSLTLNTVFDKIAPFVDTFTGPTQAAISGASRLSAVVLDTEAVGRVNVVADVLNSISDNVRVAQFPMTTLNNRTVVRRIGNDTNYVSQISSTAVDGGSSTETITPGTVREGFTMQLTPRQLPDGRILLQYSLSLIDLLGVDQFTSGQGNSVQLPRTTSRVFVQQSMLRSGNTLLLAGFSQDRQTQTSQGVGNAFNYLLGGGSNNNRTRQMLFIAITPQEIDIRQTERL